MPLISVYVDESTMATLQEYARDHDRNVEDLASCAVEEAALQVRRHQPPQNIGQKEMCLAGPV